MKLNLQEIGERVVNEMQQKAVEQLLETNSKRIPELEAQLVEIRSESVSLKCLKEIENYYNRMEQAHGNYFLSHIMIITLKI